MTVHIFGIRHHGPGSARSLLLALEQLQPDCVLIEGPPDADELLPLFAEESLQPPVALLIYVASQPNEAAYYPFAVFSPEFQAIRYALQNGVPVRFMDLPQAHQLGAAPPEPPPELPEAPAPEAQQPAEAALAEQDPIAGDPLGHLARAAGYSDGERWWEQMVEQRQDSTGVFEAILEAMAALREQATGELDLNEQRREAWMRQTIRAAEKQGYGRIAVVCGAWHGPALVGSASSAKADAALLKGMPKAKVQATFSPWTYKRLASSSGYGAGIASPGYYEHLWQAPNEVTNRWMALVARLMREQDLDASAAHVVEAVRLAEALAAIRDRPLPGLDELNEAARAVFCFGSDLPMQLIAEKLIVAERLGSVPGSAPTTPLQSDLTREQKRLRMAVEATWRDYALDLRKPIDLERSQLLHRLNLLKIPWGHIQHAGGKGTFHENWRVEWQPEFTITLIEASMWGATVAEAATAYACDTARRATALPELTALVEQALLADLPKAVAQAMRQLEEAAALSSDVPHLMEALPPLANALRYGNVRRTDSAALEHVVSGLVARICIGLPGACASLNDDAAAAMFKRISDTAQALGMLADRQHQQAWCDALRQVADMAGAHGLVAGRCCRLLLDAEAIGTDELGQRLSFALSPAATPAQAAAWVEGTLKGSGMLLIHHESLWQIIDGWVRGLTPELFQQVLPLLRRTFATFTKPERRQMGERAKDGTASAAAGGGEALPLDTARAEAALPLVAQLLGLAPAAH
ncbi:hypothetical protein F8S13_13975 [Chloroflexia bacterium SDU3-3]|nr:hypothetical protein F8S13_13975 [Chloroflexia bacterium SDU3-3]